MFPLTAARAALVMLLALGLACQDAPKSLTQDCAGRRVRMGVASSLREVALVIQHELSAQPDPIDAEMIFGASSVLARQLSLGAPMDLFVSADSEIVNDLVRQGMLNRDSTIEFARGRLVLAATQGWPKGMTDLEALDSPRLERIAIPAAAVPLGRYARRWLYDQGRLERLEGRIVTTEHARATLSAVEAGHVDLAVVYESDARLARRAVVLARIDPSGHPPIRYVAARATAAPRCKAVDEALAAWTSAETIDLLTRSGFSVSHPTEDL